MAKTKKTSGSFKHFLAEQDVDKLFHPARGFKYYSDLFDSKADKKDLMEQWNEFKEEIYPAAAKAKK